VQEKGPPFLGRRPLGVAATAILQLSSGPSRKNLAYLTEKRLVKVRNCVRVVFFSSFLPAPSVLPFLTGFGEFAMIGESPF
jgi:hypothetical protein